MDNWTILARVEDERSFFSEEDRLTEDDLRNMAATYNVEWRKAAVVCGYSEEVGMAGPSHFAGEWSAPLGFVKELDFDGYNLWGNIEEIDGKITSLVAKGFHQRSIGFWRETPEMEGLPYLRHVALLGGEPPGIPNMPSLDRFFGERNITVAPHELSLDLPWEVRTISNKEPDKMDEKLLDQIRQMVSEAVSTAIATLKPEAAPNQNQEILEEMRSLRDETRALRQERWESTVDAELSQLVRDGRLLPSEVDSERKILLKLDEESVRERFADLSQRSPILPSRLSGSLLPDSVDDDGFEINLRGADVPWYNIDSVDPQSFQMWKEAMKRSEGDPEKFRKAAYALYGEVQ